MFPVGRRGAEARRRQGGPERRRPYSDGGKEPETDSAHARIYLGPAPRPTVAYCGQKYTLFQRYVRFVGFSHLRYPNQFKHDT